MSSNRGPILKPKPKAIEPEMRRRVSDAWHGYIVLLSRTPHDDAGALQMLDELRAAVAELRDAAADKVGVI